MPWPGRLPVLMQKEIDRINILKASFKAMHMAIDQLKIRPEFLLIDGNRFMPYKKTPHLCIVKGDGKYASIAATSILAKTYGTLTWKKSISSFRSMAGKKKQGIRNPGTPDGH